MKAFLCRFIWAYISNIQEKLDTEKEDIFYLIVI